MTSRKTPNNSRWFCHFCLLTSVILNPLWFIECRAQETLVRIHKEHFLSTSGRITFSEMTIGTINPVYAPHRYGGAPGNPTVYFGGYFKGQKIAGTGECGLGAALTGCVSGLPISPLKIDNMAPTVEIVEDDTVPLEFSILLSGSPNGSGPIAIWFDKDVAAVGLYGVGFDAVSGTAITVYNRGGVKLGSIINQKLDAEFLGLVTKDGSSQIAGLLFHLVGPEPSGFGVDDIQFGTLSQVNLPHLRTPSTSNQGSPRRPIILP